MTSDNAFGDHLKGLRDSAGLTQEAAATAVAERSGDSFTESYWNKLERGAMSPAGLHPFKLVWIASVLGASASDAKALFALASEQHEHLFDAVGAYSAEAGLPSLASHIDATTELVTSERKAALKMVVQGLKAEEAGARRPRPAAEEVG